MLGPRTASSIAAHKAAASALRRSTGRGLSADSPRAAMRGRALGRGGFSTFVLQRGCTGAQRAAHACAGRAGVGRSAARGPASEAAPGSASASLASTVPHAAASSPQVSAAQQAHSDGGEQQPAASPAASRTSRSGPGTGCWTSRATWASAGCAPPPGRRPGCGWAVPLRGSPNRALPPGCSVQGLQQVSSPRGRRSS